MVRAGARVNALRALLREFGWTESSTTPSAPRIDRMDGRTADAVLDLYRRLGGIQESPRLAPGGWDLALRNGLVLELDEDMHFNRYRGATLDAPWAAALPWTDPYRSYVVAGESRAGTGGRRWTSPSSERMFGAADPDGVFASNGSPRWRQRALYDAMKDAVAACGEQRLVRLAIYDDVAGASLNDILYGRSTPDLAALESLIVKRTSGRR